MIELFKEAGYETCDYEEFADVYVINTCTVTNMSERKSRQILRRAKEINPDAILCVVGCYVQVAKEELEKLPEIDILLGTNDRKNIVTCVNDFLDKKKIGKVSIVNDIMKKLAGDQTQMIAGFQDDQVTILEPNQIYRFFAFPITNNSL